MKSLIIVEMVICTLFLMACGNDAVEDNSAPPQVEAPDVDQQPGEHVLEFAADAKVIPSAYARGVDGEWSYQRVEDEVFAGVGRTVEWNGQPINEGNEFISMRVGGLCGETNCGKQVILVNAHEEKAMRAVLTVPYEVEQNSGAGYIARAYTIQPGEKLQVGCTHLCDGEEGYEFRRAIVVSEFIENPIQ